MDLDTFIDILKFRLLNFEQLAFDAEVVGVDSSPMLPHIRLLGMVVYNLEASQEALTKPSALTLEEINRMIDFRAEQAVTVVDKLEKEYRRMSIDIQESMFRYHNLKASGIRDFSPQVLIG